MGLVADRQRPGVVAVRRPAGRIGLVVAVLAVLVLALVAPLGAVRQAVAAGGTFYVDGKHGSDGNSGLSLGSAFKHIWYAASHLPASTAAAGWTIQVVGYPDYVYRERPVPAGWDRAGTGSAPIVFQAYGYNGTSGGYTRPIVSGADSAAGPWQSSGYAGVWKMPWGTAPFDVGKNTGSIKTAIFEDTTTWLWEQTSISNLADRAQAGLGGYLWSGGYLYVAGVSSTGPYGGNPTGHAIDVIERNAFYFDGRHGVKHVEVRGFEVRHSANGISFAYGTDYGVAADNVLTGNLYMGIAAVGYQSGSVADPSVGDVIERNSASWNTLQAVKLDQGTQSATVCDNDFSHNGLQGIKVQGPPGGSSYTGTTSGVTICRNALHDQSFNPTGSAYNNASGITVANGATGITLDANEVWGNDVGIHVTQESSGLPAMNGITVSHNAVWSNRRFGLYFFDGYNGSGAGTLTSSYDVFWDNGIGVMADRGTSHKTLDHDTIHDNRGEGIKIGGYKVAPASVSVRDSLVTANGSYGIWLVTGNTLALSYTGLNGNAGADVLGSASTSHVNHQPPGYLSTATDDPGYLVVASTSYQYSAGPVGDPIGARWADGFVDIAFSPFRSDILWLASSGITSGCGTDRFCPTMTVSRGQMAAFLARALGLPATSTDYFDDDDGSLFEGDINRVAAAGIATGCGTRTFCPNDPVRRDQMASFLARALALPGTATDFFTDDAGNIHETNINRVAAAGITKGCSATMYCPKLNVTREQMAAFLHRAFG